MQRRLVIALSAIVVMIGATTGIAAANNTGTSNAGTVDAATQQRMTRLLQRGRAALSSHAAAAQPGYVPLSKGGTTDRVGDAGDPRADITNVNAYYSPDALDLSLRVVQPTNPATDPAWTSNNGIVGPEWGIDTNGDSNPEYVAIFGAGASGHLFADIVPFSSGGVGLQTCKGAKARFEHGSYIVTATPSCVGNAPHIWVGTFMVYFPDFTNPNVGGLDQAPDGRFFGPLAGPPGGYMLGAGDGGVFTYGSVPFHGSLGQLSIRNAVVDIATTSTVSGYVMLGADGGVFTFGRTTFSGSAVGFRSGRYVGIALTPSGKGYWLATSDGNILGFGDAHFYGSTAGFSLGSDVVDIAATRTGHGYYLVTSSGGVLAFGDARYHGSAAKLSLHAPIVSVVPTQTGRGYFLLAADGGVFTYGDATFHGSAGALHLSAPLVDMATTTSGNGYTLVGADGGVFTYGDASFFGSAATLPLRAPIVSISLR